MLFRRFINGIALKRRRFHRALGSERGAAAVEFALVTPAFLIMVIGIIDFSRVFWIKSSMQFAVEQTARYAMVHPDDTIAQLEDYADTEIAKVSLTGVTFTAAASTIGGVNFRTISADYTFEFLIPLIDMPDVAIQASTKTPVNDS